MKFSKPIDLNDNQSEFVTHNKKINKDVVGTWNRIQIETNEPSWGENEQYNHAKRHKEEDN